MIRRIRRRFIAIALCVLALAMVLVAVAINTILILKCYQAMALALSTAAMAEGTTDPIPAAEVPAVEAQVNAEEAAEAPATEDEQKALKDAMDAYRAAKQDKAVDDLEAELNGYVSAGNMTQEQAELILKNVKERLAAKNSVCPNCGYQFSNGGKRGQQQRGQMPGMNGQRMPLVPQM